MKNEITHPLERYKRIADPTIRQQAIDNFDEKWYKENQNDDNGLICDAIFIMCIWGDTKQGLGYWLDIHESAKNGTLELLPEPIEEPLTEPTNEPNELNQLRTENEKLRECLKEMLSVNEKYCLISESNYMLQLDKAIQQAKTLLNK